MQELNTDLSSPGDPVFKRSERARILSLDMGLISPRGRDSRFYMNSRGALNPCQHRSTNGAARSWFKIQATPLLIALLTCFCETVDTCVPLDRTNDQQTLICSQFMGCLYDGHRFLSKIGSPSLFRHKVRCPDSVTAKAKSQVAYCYPRQHSCKQEPKSQLQVDKWQTQRSVTPVHLPPS